MTGRELGALFIKSIRVKDWVHVLGLPALGMMYASQRLFLTQEFLAVLTATSLYLAHGYGVNDCFDLHYETRLTRSEFKKFLVSLYFILFADIVFSVFFLNSLVAILVFFGGCISFLYSAPPLRLKRNTFLNVPLNSIGFSILFLIGFASVRNQISLSAVMVTAFFALIFIPLQIIHFVAHADEDKRDGLLTLYNRYGIKVTTYVFSASLIIMILWPLLPFLPPGQAHPLFFSTVFLSAVLFLIFRRFVLSGACDQKVGTGVRMVFRALAIIYGLALAAIFCFL